MSRGSGWDDPWGGDPSRDDGRPSSTQRFERSRPEPEYAAWADYPEADRGYPGYAEPTRSRASGGMIAALVALGVVLLGLLGVVGLLTVRGGETKVDDVAVATQAANGAATPSAPAPVSGSGPVTVTRQPEQRDTVTVTAQAPAVSGGASSGSGGGYPAGADARGWTGGYSARCSEEDHAMVIGRTDSSRFVGCYGEGGSYYRGSSDVGTIEIGLVTSTGSGYTVVNKNVRYEISASAMDVYENGSLISHQPMYDYWSR